jgi:DNA-binding MarR family transcriptional regulator
VYIYRDTIFLVSSLSVLSVEDYRALVEFRYQLRRFLHFSESAARSSGLEPQQHQLLLAVKGLPAASKATIGELAARLFLRHHSAVELVDRLEHRGVVERAADPDDARAVLVRLTPKGDKVLAQLTDAHRKELESGPELARALRRVLRPAPEKAGSR